MADEKYTFEQARIRLEEIAAEVRKKDTSLEKSLDLLEEGVRLANICTELVDHTDVSASVVAGPDVDGGSADDGADASDDQPAAHAAAVEGAADRPESEAGDEGADAERFERVDDVAIATSEEPPVSRELKNDTPDDDTDGFDETDDEVGEPSDSGIDD